MTVNHSALEHVDEFGARVLELRENVRGTGKGDQSGFDGMFASFERAQQTILVSVPSSVYRDAPLPGPVSDASRSVSAPWNRAVTGTLSPNASR